jgi:hypothetical protein
MLADSLPYLKLKTRLTNSLVILLRVHHDGTLPGNRLPRGPAGKRQEPERLILGADQDPVTVFAEGEGFSLFISIKTVEKSFIFE